MGGEHRGCDDVVGCTLSSPEASGQVTCRGQEMEDSGEHICFPSVRERYMSRLSGPQRRRSNHIADTSTIAVLLPAEIAFDTSTQREEQLPFLHNYHQSDTLARISELNMTAVKVNRSYPCLYAQTR